MSNGEGHFEEFKISALDAMHFYAQNRFQANMPAFRVIRRRKEHVAVTR
jgi:hypothetical protein